MGLYQKSKIALHRDSGAEQTDQPVAYRLELLRKPEKHPDKKLRSFGARLLIILRTTTSSRPMYT
jgi:hypothetical protein